MDRRITPNTSMDQPTLTSLRSIQRSLRQSFAISRNMSIRTRTWLCLIRFLGTDRSGVIRCEALATLTGFVQAQWANLSNDTMTAQLEPVTNSTYDGSHIWFQRDFNRDCSRELRGNMLANGGNNFHSVARRPGLGRWIIQSGSQIKAFFISDLWNADLDRCRWPKWQAACDVKSA